MRQSRISFGNWLPSLKLAGTLLFGSMLLTTVQGCSSNSSIPAPPILTSLQRASLDGEPGLWMSDSDAGTLALWIYNVSGISGL